MVDEPSLVSVGREPGLRFQFGSLERGQPALFGSTPTTLAQAGKAFDMPCSQIYEEASVLKCQAGISSSRLGGRRRSLPYAFTEEGVTMLPSVLRSERAGTLTLARDLQARECVQLGLGVVGGRHVLVLRPAQPGVPLCRLRIDDAPIKGA